MADQFFWTAADGTVVNLSDVDAGYSVLASGTRGLRSVTYEMATSAFAGIDGVKVDAIRATASEPSLGMIIQAAGEDDLRERMRRLVRLMRPKAGLGTLTVARSNGERRHLACYYKSGLEGDEAVDALLAGSWWKALLTFFAPEPWWQGDVQSVNFGLGAPSSFFPIFPLELSASSVQGEFTVDLSETDAPAFPQWSVTGPGSSLVLANLTTGRRIQVDAPLAAGESMFIDTRPGHQSIRRGDGVNLLQFLASEPALWPLVETVNEVSAQLVGASSLSRIAGTYRPRFSGI